MTIAPVLDTDALGRLADQLDDPEILCGFIRRYESMLGRRVDRLHHALTAQDHEDWMDAILSLKTSSAMVGAAALSRLAADLQANLTHRPPAPVGWPTHDRLEDLISKLRALATETAHQLRAFVESIAAPATAA
jgi:HPt (histidine-containing phosphotransfer) domain-containing protein